jgi:hypothetical protein
VFWLLFIAAVVAATAIFTWRLATGDDRWRFAALYTGCICVVIAGLFTLQAYIALRWTCDESCYPGAGWRHSPDAWQWHAKPVLASVGLAGVTLALLLVALRRYRAGLVMLGGGVLAFVPFAAI